jgi:hypothetical protein
MNSNMPSQELNPEIGDDLRRDLENLVARAYRVSTDMGDQLQQIIRLGDGEPLTGDEAVQLLSRVIERLKASAFLRRDEPALAALEGDAQQRWRSISVPEVHPEGERKQSSETVEVADDRPQDY